MNKTLTSIRPFLCQFEVVIPLGGEGEFLDPAGALSANGMPSTVVNILNSLGVTKTTRVREETTDDE